MNHSILQIMRVYYLIFPIIMISLTIFSGLIKITYGQVNETPSFMNMNETEESKPNTTVNNNPSGLEILSHNSFSDSLGYLHVVGEIKNNYPSTVTFVTIVGTFYDINNRVVGTQFTYANPSDIGSGERAPFELILSSASVPISQIDHYNLQTTYQ
ncbi:MAG: DUF3426 domain-containing protein [Thermoproteota archaeon]|nr:DUF3426 domain-containing protein [Thermoproteota archaeon]